METMTDAVDNNGVQDVEAHKEMVNTLIAAFALACDQLHPDYRDVLSATASLQLNTAVKTMLELSGKDPDSEKQLRIVRAWLRDIAAKTLAVATAPNAIMAKLVATGVIKVGIVTPTDTDDDDSEVDDAE